MARLSSLFSSRRKFFASQFYFAALLLPIVSSNSYRIMPSTAAENVVRKLFTPKDKGNDYIRMAFSDVDGTLVHYPESTDGLDSSILKLPPSATGMRGIISSQTLAHCQEIRNRGVKLVLVSGMRTSTLLKRLPFLPRADAYCSEAGGRIFLPRPSADDNQLSFTVVPESYVGADPKDLVPFEIVEDMEWRGRMERKEAAGADGYHGAELDLKTSEDQPVPIEERTGALWDFARQLTNKGYVLDIKGYASCFRVNRKQQTKVSNEDFEQLLLGNALPCPPGIATSVNLGCIDYYPVESGKKNCCEYLASKFLDASASPSDLLSRHCVCFCDDDNDLEMASACQHAYLPGISSESMARVVASNPDHYSQTGGSHHEGIEGTKATEKALLLALDRMATP